MDRLYLDGVPAHLKDQLGYVARSSFEKQGQPTVEGSISQIVEEEPWISELPEFRQEYLGEEDLEEIFEPFDCVEHRVLEAGATYMTRKFLSEQGYSVQEKPMVDFTVATKC